MKIYKNTTLKNHVKHANKDKTKETKKNLPPFLWLFREITKLEVSKIMCTSQPLSFLQNC